MKNEVISKRRTWTAPQLRVLSPDDTLVRRAALQDPAFAAELHRHDDDHGAMIARTG
jgi:hypothetical protein